MDTETNGTYNQPTSHPHSAKHNCIDPMAIQTTTHLHNIQSNRALGDQGVGHHSETGEGASPQGLS